MCHASVKENKNLRLEVHHAKTFDDICNENNVSRLEQALGCKELWSLKNGISICYSCHKDIERLRTKLRSMFWLKMDISYNLMQFPLTTLVQPLTPRLKSEINSSV